MGHNMIDTFDYEAAGHTLVIHLPKELDHHNCRNLRYETDLLLAENFVSRVVFDFSKTVFMDSAGVAVLLNRYKQMQGSGGLVTLYGAGPQVKRILKVGGINGLIQSYDSKEEAMVGRVKTVQQTAGQ